jgi:hypothetical protein
VFDCDLVIGIQDEEDIWGMYLLAFTSLMKQLLKLGATVIHRAETMMIVPNFASFQESMFGDDRAII